MKLLKAKRQALKEQNSKFGPTLREVFREDWPEEALHRADQPLRVWQSKDFSVQLWQDRGHMRLTVCRTAINSDGGWKDGITWDELNRLKEEAGLGHLWAIEIYPPTEQVVNVANMRHLWLLHSAPTCAWVKPEVAP